jgi:hypothetical protein
MKRKSSYGSWIAAIVGLAFACGGAVNVNAGEKVKGTVNAYGGTGYDPWSGYGSGGYGTAAMGYAGPNYNSTGMSGYTGGYGAGPCCNGVWDGYCAEKRLWCEGHVKHRCRPLGRGAGPCCPSSCGHCGGSPAAPVCRAAPGKSWCGFFHRRKPCIECVDEAKQVIEETTVSDETAEAAAEPSLTPVPDAAN